MNLLSVNPKLGILATVVTGAILIMTFRTIAIATPDEHQKMKGEQMQQYMQEQMKIRLDKLALRLKIKVSQQAVWEDFAKSIEALPRRNAKKPADDADAATIARYHANRAAEMADKLAKIADVTAKLETALTSDQRKVLDQTAQLFLHHRHGANFGDDGMEHGEMHHGRNHDEHGAS